MRNFTKTITLLLIIMMLNAPSVLANDLSEELAALEDEYNFLISVVNDKNKIILSDGVQRELGLNKIVYLQEFQDAVLNRIYNLGRQPYPSEIREATIAALSLSNEIKYQLRATTLPNLESDIRELRQEVAYREDRDRRSANQNHNVRFNDRGTGPQCLDQNPDTSRDRHEFDTNNNPDDRTFIRCTYFKNGQLKWQSPYTDNELDGVQLKYIIRTRPGRFLKTRIDWRSGERIYRWEWKLDDSGKVFKFSETGYSSDRISSETIWDTNGNIM